MKRSLILLALLALVATPVAGSHKWDFNSGGKVMETYTYDHNTNKWKDDACGPGTYKVIFWENAGFSGDSTRVCHATTHVLNGANRHAACFTPLGNAGVGKYHAEACEALLDNNGVLNDNATGIEVLSLPAGLCFFIYANVEWGGAWRQFNTAYGHGSYGNLSNVLINGNGFNDRMSSWKSDDCVSGEPIF